ncbi:MAG: endonuclease/exonuclease/phosphatase family protein [Lyngbya sp. HA4199-MV5]|jgi:endonuclease/exonuclease/phosphatase (EEP) superfamily protein YafD|nr:endonuclease/exonuclease/phosphatase family protein [Lyngbya sp. HA4199-MV5]
MGTFQRRSSLHWLFIVSLAAGLGLVTLLSLTGSLGWLHWRLDLTAHFKQQYLVVCLCAVVCLWLWRTCVWRRWLLGLSLFGLALNLVAVVPWYLPQPTVVTPAMQLRVLHANVLVRNRNHESVLALVKETNPEIAIFQEVNTRWLEALEPLRTTLPYQYAEPDAAGFGNVIFSALPLQQPSVQFLGQSEYASLVVQISKGGKTVSLLTAHPPPPIREELFQWRNQWLAAIAPFARSQTHPLIVIGDFNISMWSPYYQQAVQAAGLQNSRAGFGILPSWSPRRWLPWLAIPIDHCLVSSDIVVQRTQTGRNIGSDHLPLLVELAIP